ncbi:MAG: hypothetical protein ACOCVA_04005 [Prolixibacteraceae bacterium]
MCLKKKLLIIALLFLSFLSFGQEEKKEDGFKFGGAMRFNFLSTNYENPVNKLNTQFTWDTWRLNVDGSMVGIDLSFEYRFYPTFGSHFIHHGYLGYAFSDNIYMELGVTQVPFGVTPYASHSWWFQGPYYVGLEDDYDMGINFDITPTDKLEINVSYFRQAEPEGPKFGGDVTFGNAGPGRYSYDIVPGTGAYVADNGNIVSASASLRELDQFNVRAAYNIIAGWEIGASAQIGGIYNSVLEKSETGTAFAGHIVGNFGNFNLKAEYIYYNYNARSDDGQKLDVLQMGAYGYEYFGGEGYTGGVAAKANMYVAGLAYTIPVDFGPVSGIQPYVDYTMIDKTNENCYNTQHFIPGFLISAGAVYIYADYALGKNQPWLTSSFGKGLGSGVENPDWNRRFNINIGYYF